MCGFATNGSIAVYDQVLFTAHMAGHLALVMVAPVLLVAGHPLTLALAAAEPARRERLARIATGRVVSLLTAPPVALAAYTVVIVGSHLTGLMDEIMRNTWAGQLEHLVYVLVGCQFFVLVVGARADPVAAGDTGPLVAARRGDGGGHVYRHRPAAGHAGRHDAARSAGLGRSAVATPAPAERSCGSPAMRS